MLEKGENRQAKYEEKGNKKTQQDIILTQYNEAVNAWSKDKDNVDARNAVNTARSAGIQYGLNLPNVVSQHISEKMAGSNIDLRNQGLDQQKTNAESQQDYQKQQLDLQERRLAADQWMNQQRLDLDKLKLLQAQNAKLTLSGDEAQKIGQLENAEPIFDRLENQIADDLVVNTTADNINSKNSLIRSAANKLASADTQVFANAKQMVRNMIGRDLSGAAIAEGEWNAFEANIPTYGDTPEILKQKKKNRIDWIDDKKNRGKNRTEDPKPKPDSVPTKPLYKSIGAIKFESLDGGKTWSKQ